MLMVNGQIHCCTHTHCLTGPGRSHTRAQTILYWCRLHAFNRTTCRVNSSIKSSQTKYNLYPKGNPFCINLICISQKSVAKLFLKYNCFYRNHSNTYILRFIFSNGNFEIFTKELLVGLILKVLCTLKIRIMLKLVVHSRTQPHSWALLNPNSFSQALPLNIVAFCL